MLSTNFGCILLNNYVLMNMAVSMAVSKTTNDNFQEFPNIAAGLHLAVDPPHY